MAEQSVAIASMGPLFEVVILDPDFSGNLLFLFIMLVIELLLGQYF